LATLSTKKRLALNVVMNWAATAVNMVVPFFLTPFVVRHLGAVGYGVWILAVSTVSYLALLDMGMRSAIIRYVSKAQAREQPQEATAAIHAALWFRCIIAAGVGVISFILAALTPHIFKIPADMMRAAQITVLLCALGVAVTLMGGVFGAVLAALNRFDLLSSITITQTLTRAVGVLLILFSGHGLVALACWELIVLVLVAFATTLCAMKTFPHCRMRPSKPDMTVLRMIWSYSFTTFIFMIAVQIVTNTDNLVVGAFLSVSLVTFFSIGSSLVAYSSQVSSALSTTFTPMASGLEASGRMDDLRRMLIRGTQATLALSLPISAGLFFRGGTFIRLWMGPEYQVVSENVVRILTVAMFFGIADATAGSIMMAIEKHKPMARWAVFEAVFNLGLSIVLVKTVGLYGVAWGTTISTIITHVAFWPRYIDKTLQVSPRTYLWHGWGKITLCTVPFALACAVEDRYWHAAHLITFFAQIAVILPIYALSLIVSFREESSDLIRRWRASRGVLVKAA
jgi:O-antigen/teichoic acid export membrane protein